MSRGCDCLIATGLLVGSVVVLAISILTGAIVGNGGVAHLRAFGTQFSAAPLEFFKEVVEGSRGFYTDPLSYMLAITSDAKERLGSPIAWWDCDAEIPCLVDRIAVRAMRWASIWGLIGEAVKDMEQPEALQRIGNWSYAMIWEERSGECLLLGTTLCEEVLQLLANVGLDGQLLAVKLSVLQPGTQLSPHTGPRQDRFRVMLPLVVPKVPKDEELEGAKSLGLHVGNRSQELILGKPLCFNDAVRHTAWNLRDGPRVALLIDFKHPSLTETPFCSAEAKQIGSSLCQAACDALLRRKNVCGVPKFAVPFESCMRECKGALTWNARYVKCLESEENCWEGCESLKSSRAASQPLRLQSGIDAPSRANWLFYRYLNAFVYRLSDFLLGIKWNQSYY